MTQLPQKITLPAAIAEKLEVVRRRTLRVSMGTAIVTAICVLLAAMGVAMLIDWLATIYDFRWRALLTYTAWSAAAITLVAWAVAAWRHTQRVERVAAKVDREIPELEERWSTVTEITSSNGSPGENSGVVHPAMFQQVSKEAQSWTPRVEADRVIPLDGLIRALLFLTAITTVLGIAVVLDSQRTTVLMRRFWQPYAPISATELTDLSGDLVVGRGESLEIAAHVVGTPVDEASLILQPEEGDEKTITLVPRGDEQDELSHRMRTVKEPLRYRLRAGDGQSPWYNIVVADRPKLGDVRVTLTPPAYTRKEPKIINKLPRRVTVLEGSSVEIALKPKQQLKSLALKFSPERSEQLSAGDDGWYRWQSTLNENIAFQTMLVEEHGLGNLRPPKCEIKIRPDRPPVVKILTPNSEMAVRPDDQIPVTFVASDDVGVHQAELIVYDENNRVDGKPAVLDRIPVPLGDQQGAVKVKASVKLDLSKYETTDGAQLSFSVRVREDRGQQYLAESQAAQGAENAVAAVDGQQPEQQTVTTDDSATNQEETQGATGQLANASDADAKPAEQEQTAAVSEGEGNTIVAQTDSRQPAADEKADSTGDASALERLAARVTPMIGDDSSDSDNAANGQSRGDLDDQQASDAITNRNENSSQDTAVESPNAATQPSATASSENGNEATMADSGDRTAEGENATNADGQSRTASSARQSLNTSDRASSPEPTTPTTGEPSEMDAADSSSADSDSSNNAGASEANDQTNAGQSNNNSQSSDAQGNSSQAGNSSRNNQSPESNAQSGNQQSGNQSSPSQNSNNSDGMQDSQQSEPQGGTPSPGNPMSKRELDVESAQSSSSQRMRLKIDEWAGSYDGQQRAKLEIAIAPKLEAIDRSLEKAENLSRSVLDDNDAGKPWASKHDRDIQRADEQIASAIQVIEDLENETYGTPYAFVGLQLVDIKQAHISLARRDFWKSLQTKDAARVDSVRNGWQHTIRARELIVLLTERFERTKIEYKMAESVENIKKMYRIFVEDSMELLRQDGEGSRYGRKVAEFDLDDEYLKRLEEVIKMRNEMRAELARILADDPRLLRRFLDAQRNRQTILRNELDRLTEDQSELNRETRAWAAADEADRPPLAKILIGRHIESAQDIAIAAADLHDRFETWSPLGKEVEDDDFQATAAVLQEIATATRELSSAGLDYVEESTRAKKIEEPAEADEPEEEQNPFNPNEAVEQISQDAQQLYERFTRLEVLLRQIGGRNDRAEIASFATNRLLETRRLIEQTSAWIRQLKQQQAGNYHRAAEVGQYRLATRTDTLAGKLAGLEQTMAGLLQNDGNMLPKSIADKARALLAALDEQAAPNQLAAVYALRRNQMSRATSRQETALAALQQAGKLYDEMIEAAIIELDKLPVQDPIASLLDDPTLDDLLRELEQEIPIEEALGIPARPSNLQIMTDWLRSGGDNALMTGGNRRMMMEQMRRQQEMRQRQLERAYRRAVARALNEAEAEDLVKNMPKLARETADWNRLASQLEDDLRQGRDKAPPERYRRAIEQYFRQVSGADKAE